MTLKPISCPNCGGRVDTARMVCEFCGTKFDYEMQPLRIETYTCPVRTFQSRTAISDEIISYYDGDYVAEYAMRDITKQLAEHLREMLELRTEYDARHCQHIITARMRVVDPNYRF